MEPWELRLSAVVRGHRHPAKAALINLAALCLALALTLLQTAAAPWDPSSMSEMGGDANTQLQTNAARSEWGK